MKSCEPHSCRVVGAWVVKLQEWHPEGQAYAGLPTDLDDARERLAARMPCWRKSARSQPPFPTQSRCTAAQAWG